MRCLPVAAVLLAATGVCRATPPSPPDLTGGGMLAAYTPLGFTPDPGWRPRAAALRADGTDLVRLGVRAVVTARATRPLGPVCRFLKRQGVRSVIIGIGDPTDAAELRAARRLWRCAEGYAVGSGGLAAGRYRRAALESAVTYLHRVTGRPVAIREPVESYRADPTLLGVGDWMFPLAAPDLTHGAQEACGATMTADRELLERGPQDRPIAFAAAGVGTAGAPGANEHAQRAYFSCLASRQVPFAHDEAYDQPWRGGAAGARGLFRADGTPKLFAWQLARPSVTIERAAPALAGRATSVSPGRARVLVYTAGERWDPLPPAPLSRAGRWTVAAPAGRRAAVFVAAPDYAPTEALDRPPPLDGVRLFATAATPPDAR